MRVGVGGAAKRDSARFTGLGCRCFCSLTGVTLRVGGGEVMV